MWERGEVDAYQHEVKAFTHPDIGRLTLDCDILPLDGQQEYQDIIYTAAPQSRSASQLRRLLIRSGDDATMNSVSDASA